MSLKAWRPKWIRNGCHCVTPIQATRPWYSFASPFLSTSRAIDFLLRTAWGTYQTTVSFCLAGDMLCFWGREIQHIFMFPGKGTLTLILTRAFEFPLEAAVDYLGGLHYILKGHIASQCIFSLDRHQTVHVHRMVLR